jgi:uncharacterized protein YndB with AHSA1/START domain
MEWTGARYADQPEVEVEAFVAAPPERVWPLLDPARMPPTSTELQSVEWLDGATGPAEGARFLGRNVHPSLGEWSVAGTVVACEPGSTLAWEMDSADEGVPSSRWTLRCVPDGDGTRVQQKVRLGPGRSGLSQAIEAMPDKEQKIVFVRLREFEGAMTRTLEAVREQAEA